MLDTIVSQITVLARRVATQLRRSPWLVAAAAAVLFLVW